MFVNRPVVLVEHQIVVAPKHPLLRQELLQLRDNLMLCRDYHSVLSPQTYVAIASRNNGRVPHASRVAPAKTTILGGDGPPAAPRRDALVRFPRRNATTRQQRQVDLGLDASHHC